MRQILITLTILIFSTSASAKEISTEKEMREFVTGMCINLTNGVAEKLKATKDIDPKDMAYMQRELAIQNFADLYSKLCK